MIVQESINNEFFIDENGNKKWYKDNLLHRDDDLPTVEYTNGHKDLHVNNHQIKLPKI